MDSRRVLEKLYATKGSLDVGRGNVNPRTVRSLLRRGLVFTWASGEYDPAGPFVHVAAKKNDVGGRYDGFVRTECSCDAGVLLLRCEACGATAHHTGPRSGQ